MGVLVAFTVWQTTAPVCTVKYRMLQIWCAQLCQNHILLFAFVAARSLDAPHAMSSQHCCVFSASQHTIKWLGRLPGDLLATTPSDYEAWWLAPGQVFSSQPVSDGDVAWEAMVQDNKLAEYGCVYDERQRLVVMTAGGKQDSHKEEIAEAVSATDSEVRAGNDCCSACSWHLQA